MVQHDFDQDSDCSYRGKMDAGENNIVFKDEVRGTITQFSEESLALRVCKKCKLGLEAMVAVSVMKLETRDPHV